MSEAHFIEPMPCLAVKTLPEGEAWEYELKLEGYRALAVKHDGRVMLFSRNRKRLTSRFPDIAAAFARLPDYTIVDGEIVAMDESGRPSINRLQNFSANDGAITFYAFDMPMWTGEDLRKQPLDNRRDSSLSAEAFRSLADALIKRDCVKLNLAYVPPPWQNCGGHLVRSLADYRMSWQKWRWISFPRRTCRL